MRTHQKQGAMIMRCTIIALSLFIGLHAAFAKPVVRIAVDPNVTTMTLAKKPQKIRLNAQVSASNMKYAWKIEGPGTFKGDATNPGILYIPPESIEGRSAQVVLTVTVTDSATGEQNQDRIALTLLAPEETQPQTARLTVRSNVRGDLVWIDGKRYQATPVNVELSVGTHQIRIEKEECEPFETTITLQQDDTVRGVLSCQQPTPIPTSTPKIIHVKVTPTPTPAVKSLSQNSKEIVTPSQEEMNIVVWFDKQCGSPYKQGEKILISFKASSDGYLTMYDIDTRGLLSVIFPNKHQPNNYVRGGQTYTVPDRTYSYDLIVEGPEGIEYIDAVISNDPYYAWDYRKGEPRWVREWGLTGRTNDNTPASDYKSSMEYKYRPEGFSQEGEQSIANNVGISQKVRERIRSQLTTKSRANGEEGSSNYGTATCYIYVTSARPLQRSDDPSPSRQEYIEQQQKQFQQISGLDVRLSDDHLIVTIPSTILFDADSYALRYEARRVLDQIASILMNFQETIIKVAGHSDSVGNSEYNQKLSEYRAQSVSNYLVTRGVPPYRIGSSGYGETKPLASNSTENGRQRNRRIELDIYMNQ